MWECDDGRGPIPPIGLTWGRVRRSASVRSRRLTSRRVAKELLEDLETCCWWQWSSGDEKVRPSVPLMVALHGEQTLGRALPTAHVEASTAVASCEPVYLEIDEVGRQYWLRPWVPPGRM